MGADCRGVGAAAVEWVADCRGMGVAAVEWV